VQDDRAGLVGLKVASTKDVLPPEGEQEMIDSTAQRLHSIIDEAVSGLLVGMHQRLAGTW
jgi:hypothetical protein